jgi:redox-sensitive bicupin YhaK (pirin superfamily)
MIQLRPSAARGFADHGWLLARHSFSFADYYDPAEMGWGVLRVINEDRVAPGKGFATHGHRDMEIVTYVIAGALEHRDSLGNGEVIRPGEVQRMSAGSGVRHSEFNPSASEETHLLQIWIEPRERGIAPSYEQQALAPGENTWRLIASPDAAAGSTLIHQDARLYAARLLGGATLEYALDPTRLAYVQVVRGEVQLNGLEIGPALRTGDGAKIADESALHFLADAACAECEILLFDLPHQGVR